ncbi:hypothetical protein QUB80_32365 [Chlorogloeopsis sp. ULAP01]|nr:hypothetical protein [Chlorogloeopsis sp. ULAP01]MDM9385350.1 hypothetical protein [Chlorogloeopsis sp. ULAP01]
MNINLRLKNEEIQRYFDAAIAASELVYLKLQYSLEQQSFLKREKLVVRV